MNCPVCLSSSTAPALSGTDFLFQTTSRKFDLHACSSCDCLFINPLPAMDEIASFYPAQYWWSGAQPTFLKRLESIYRKVALRDHIAFISTAAGRLHRKGVKLLDVGCGSGTLIGLLKQRGFQVLGVDTSEEASDVARIENDVTVVVGTLDEVQVENHSFDMVTLFHVMEHVTNPRRVLAEVDRILKPAGILVLQVPNIDSWQFRWFGSRWYGLDIPRHVIDYSRTAILKLLSDSGFSVKRVRQFNLRDNAPALVSSLFPGLDPLSRPIRLRRINATEFPPVSWAKHLMYLGFVICAYPVAMLEAAFGHGATVMIEAHKR
jgi:2-polyprenyl-3-methyl-5-hydroxy-6-metoxy-1,4-benzoquinol methylase